MLDDLEGLRDGYGAEAVRVLRHHERLLLCGTGDLQVGLRFQREFVVLPVDQTLFLDSTLPLGTRKLFLPETQMPSNNSSM